MRSSLSAVSSFIIIVFIFFLSRGRKFSDWVRCELKKKSALQKVLRGSVLSSGFLSVPQNGPIKISWRQTSAIEVVMKDVIEEFFELRADLVFDHNASRREVTREPSQTRDELYVT